MPSLPRTLGHTQHGGGTMRSCDDQEARSLGDVSGAGDHRAAPSLEAWTPSLGAPRGRRLGVPAGQVRGTAGGEITGKSSSPLLGPESPPPRVSDEAMALCLPSSRGCGDKREGTPGSRWPVSVLQSQVQVSCSGWTVSPRWPCDGSLTSTLAM